MNHLRLGRMTGHMSEKVRLGAVTYESGSGCHVSHVLVQCWDTRHVFGEDNGENEAE